MSYTKKIVLSLSTAALMTLSTAGVAADGAAIYADKCQACHGADGNTPLTPAYPKIGDLSADAVTSAIAEYQSGARSGGTTAIMKGIADKLTPEEVAAVAAHIGS